MSVLVVVTTNPFLVELGLTAETRLRVLGRWSNVGAMTNARRLLWTSCSMADFNVGMAGGVSVSAAAIFDDDED